MKAISFFCTSAATESQFRCLQKSKMNILWHSGTSMCLDLDHCACCLPSSITLSITCHLSIRAELSSTAAILQLYRKLLLLLLSWNVYNFIAKVSFLRILCLLRKALLLATANYSAFEQLEQGDQKWAFEPFYSVNWHFLKTFGLFFFDSIWLLLVSMARSGHYEPFNSVFWNFFNNFIWPPCQTR